MCRCVRLRCLHDRRSLEAEGIVSELPLLDWQPRGATIDPARDTERLKGQLAKVYVFMRQSDWVSLDQISAATGAPPASASARLRDIRALGFTVERKFVCRGLHHYRLKVTS